MTIRQFENERSAPLRVTLEVLRRAFEEGGVELTNDERPGVRLSKPGTEEET